MDGMIYFIAGFLCACALLGLTLKCVQASLDFHYSSTIQPQTLSEEELEEIKDAEEERTKQFNQTFANLNAFMTGEEVKNE